MKKYSDSEILSITQKAPVPIRERIENVQTALTVAEIGQRFNLHIDQIGTIAELNRNMLLGLVNPQEFLNELIAAKVPEKDAREIMTEINQKIFVPLREQMRNAPPTEVKPPQKPTQIPPQPSRPAQQPPRHQNIALRDALATITKKTPQPLDSGKLLEDHEEPSPSLKATEGTAHIEFNKAPAVPSVVMPPAPSKAPPPPILQKAVPPKPIVRAEPEDKLKPAAPSAPAKPYSIDPYREPVDEK
jgi:hypothetical protein